MSVTNPNVRGHNTAAEAVWVWLLAAVLVIPALVVWAAAGLAVSAAGGREKVPDNPWTFAIELIFGKAAWPRYATAIAVAILLALLTAGAAIARACRGRRPNRHRIDRAARYMAAGREIAPLTVNGSAGQLANRLGLQTAGLPVCKHRQSGVQLYASWEDVGVLIAGQRTGKTTGPATAWLVSAPGGAYGTSNKPDLVELTRGVREQHGRVWVFDPQSINGEEPWFRWDPLAYITDERTARRVAAIFAEASRQRGATIDGYFEPSGKTLVAAYLLAAALERRTLLDVQHWISDYVNDEPAEILKDHGFREWEVWVRAKMAAAEEEKSGLYGTGQTFCAWMLDQPAMRWVVPQGKADDRPLFDPHAFARSGTDTLYSLSQEGPASCAALVTWLTVAIFDAAEKYALEQGGRLPVPFVAVLDEAANTVLWDELPAKYSHYGSKGICVLTILQSYTQGEARWGAEGIGTMWGSANVKLYGGGSADARFLRDLQELIGTVYIRQGSLTHNTGGAGPASRSYSQSVHQVPILDVSDLTSLPKGYVVLFSSGVRATLGTFTGWWTQPYAEQVQASLDRYGVAARSRRDTSRAEPPATRELPNPWIKAA